MSSTKYVLASLFKKNLITFFPQQVNEEIDCENTKVEGIEYMVPVVNNGVFINYINRIIEDPADVPADAVRTIRIQNFKTTDTFWVLADDADTVSSFTDHCNACCDTEDNDFVKDAADFPLPILEVEDCTPAGQNATFNAGAPINPFASNVTLNNFTYNGGQPMPFTLAAGGYASTSALASALNTNASALGTWSAPAAGKLRLVSTTVRQINLDVSLVSKLYCLPLPSSGYVGTTLVMTDNSNVAQNVTISPTTISRVNRNAVLNELRKFIVGDLTIVDGGSGVFSIQYSGTQKPVRVQNADGSTTTAFVAGAC